MARIVEMSMMCLGFVSLLACVGAFVLPETSEVADIGMKIAHGHSQTGVDEVDASVLLEEDAEGVQDQQDEPPILSLMEEGEGAEVDDLMHVEKTSVEDFYDIEANSEKIDTSTFDCADEVMLRLAIAESFYGPSYDACINHTTTKAFNQGGSGHTLMKPGGSGGSGMTRAQVDDRIKRRCITLQGHGAALGPRLVRMTFHDAADFNNSMLANGTLVPLSKTGVDSCLRTALLSVGLSQMSNDDNLTQIAKGDPNHNRGLRNSEKWVLSMAAASKLSQPDMQILGAVVAMESWFQGPEMGVKYGRVKGDCQRMVCMNSKCWDSSTPFFKQPVAEPVDNGMFCPMTNTLEPLRQVMGLSLDELVALQGAHSIGGVIVCSGLGNVAKGPYCPSNCGIPPGRFFDNGNLDGTAFDDTPGKLDNRYYQLLMGETYDDLPACDEANKYFPTLSKNGLVRAGNQSVGGSGGSGGGKNDLATTCSAGLQYDPENACTVEACANACDKTPVCLAAQNTQTFDKASYYQAWGACLDCKRQCSGSHTKKFSQTVFKTNFTACKKNCNSSAACMQSAGFVLKKCRGACRKTYDSCKSGFKTCLAKCAKGKSGRTCRKSCKTALTPCQKDQKTCLDACSASATTKKTCRTCPKTCRAVATAAAQLIYNSSGKRPAKWCKRLSPVAKCMNASIKCNVNGGCRNCPPHMLVKIPNTGSGRLTIIQNLERWTKFRGLYKRIMVLPSDWSYLGANNTKNLFKRYGTNENDWKNMFTQAFTKVSELGWNNLNTCQPKACNLASGKLTCPVPSNGIGNFSNPRADRVFRKRRADVGLPPFVRQDLEFNASTCVPPIPTAEYGCQVVGGFGVKAKVSCQSYIGYCTTAAAKVFEANITDEWAASGGQSPTCNHPTMLDTDASAQTQAELETAASPSFKRTRRHRKLRGSFPEDGAVFMQGDMDITEGEDVEENYEDSDEIVLSHEDGKFEL